MQRKMAVSVEMLEFWLFPTRGVATRLPKLTRLLSAMLKRVTAKERRVLERDHWKSDTAEIGV